MENTSVAFVLIDCSDDHREVIINEMEQIDDITEVTRLKDHWKIIAKIESKDMDGVREVIRWKVRKIPEIKCTMTLVEYMR